MNRNEEASQFEEDPLWYKDAILYELHVRAFYDSAGDGVGDFPGLAEKLDYLRDLGVTAIWLLPFYPSPLKDDGYDIAGYTDVHPSYGKLRDFQELLHQAHERGLRVITELVLNHTSDQHPWFQRARQASSGSRWRDFYVWSDTPETYKDARVIFKDFEASNWTWDPAAKAYYWHRFYSHQPDLNYDNPYVRREMLRVIDFWLKAGVDGLRLDAVPYLYERDGTNCENLPESHAFLKELRRHVDMKFKGRVLLAEANQWPEDAVSYLGQGDECHMAFHFPLMPRLFMSGQMEDRFPIIEILQQTPPIPDVCQWAIFLRNHDELTLEMVTDEERDYMYRVYAQDHQARINLGIRRRLAPLLGNDRRKIELMNGLLFSLPGTPVIYYGDEIGMGDNFYLGDRNGVRTPMQWSADRNAGFSQGTPQRLYLPINIDPEYHYETINVETQQKNPNSLLWWMKRLIALRKHFRAFGKGSLEFLYPANRKVLAFLRRYQDERVLVVANLSRFAQCVELDLSAFSGMVPVELFGQTAFPPVSKAPYLLTLGPHAFYWFALETRHLEPISINAVPSAAQVPTLGLKGDWEDLFKKGGSGALNGLLVSYMRRQRWFGGKARTIQGAEIQDTFRMSYNSSAANFVLIRVEYTDGEPETYLLPIAFASGAQAEEVLGKAAQSVIARIELKEGDSGKEAILYEALADREFCNALLEAIARRRRFSGEDGEVVALPTRELRQLLESGEDSLDPSILKAEQSNTSVVYGNRLLLKLFRHLGQGINPDLELERFLTEEVSFQHVPPLAGSLEYQPDSGEGTTLAMVLEFVPDAQDAWRYTLDSLGSYFERALARRTEVGVASLSSSSLLSLTGEKVPAVASELIGSYLEVARLLGQRTAELHLALTTDTQDPDFAPEPFSELYRRALYHGMLGLTDQAFQLLRQNQKDLPKEVQENARRVLELEEEIRRHFRVLSTLNITAMRTRYHGDYHLGQVLFTGKDFMIIDFEGEPTRPLSERRIKRSPLRDVAGMLRSFHYASCASLLGRAPGVRPEDLPSLRTWARFWQLWVSTAFLKSYLKVAAQGAFLPKARRELRVLLDAYLMEKAVYELSYELNNRPEWVPIPLQGILQLLEPGG